MSQRNKLIAKYRQISGKDLSPNWHDAPISRLKALIKQAEDRAESSRKWNADLEEIVGRMIAFDPQLDSEKLREFGRINGLWPLYEAFNVMTKAADFKKQFSLTIS